MITPKRQHHPTAAEDRIPSKEIWALAWGGFGTGGAFGIASQLLTFVYVFTLGVNPKVLALAGTIGAIIGLVAGPFIGQFCDNYRSRWGRRRPILFFTGAPIVLLASLMFFVPNGLNDWGMAFWVLAITVPMNILNSIYSTSLGALGVEATTDYHERVRLGRYLQTFALAVGFGTQFVFPLAKHPIFGGTMNGVHIIVGVLTIPFFIAAFAPLLCKERRYALIANKPVNHNVLANVKESITNIGDVCKNRPFVVVVIINIVTFFCYNIVSVMGGYMNTYYVFGGDRDAAALPYGWLGGSYCLAGGLAVAFIYPAIARKWGKKTSLQIAATVLIVDCLSKLIVYNHSYPWWFQFIVLASNGISVQGIMFSIGSMMGDIINLDELNTGKRREAVYGSLIGWATGIGTAIAGLLSGFIIDWIGFNAKIGAQSHHTLEWMKYLYFLFPFVGGLFALFMSTRYDLTEDRVYEIRDALKKRAADEKAGNPEPALP